MSEISSSLCTVLLNYKSYCLTNKIDLNCFTVDVLSWYLNVKMFLHCYLTSIYITLYYVTSSAQLKYVSQQLF